MGLDVMVVLLFVLVFDWFGVWYLGLWVWVWVV